MIFQVLHTFNEHNINIHTIYKYLIPLKHFIEPTAKRHIDNEEYAQLV